MVGSFVVWLPPPYHTEGEGAATLTSLDQHLLGHPQDLQHDDEDLRLELLRDLRVVFAEDDREFIPTDQLVPLLTNLPERPYESINDHKAINAHWLARQLRPFEIRSKQERSDNGTGKKLRGYHLAAFEKVFACYLGPSEASESSEADASDASDRPSGIDGVSAGG